MERAAIENRAPPPWSTSSIPPWSTATRPLSDIRELTEPSLIDISNRDHIPERKSSLSRKGSLGRSGSPTRQASVHRSGSLTRKGSVGGIDKSTIKPITSQCAELEANERNAISPGGQTDRSSAYSLPLENVPPRSSSQLNRKPSFSQPREAPIPPAPPHGLGYTIPNRGRSRSPVKAAADRSNPLIPDNSRKVPSRTYNRTEQGPNLDILEFPCHRHPRVAAELQIAASLFVGGSSIEGYVRVTVEDIERIRRRRALAIGRISIDLLGVEELSSSKREVFLNLACELLDSDNPPPHNMVDSLKQLSPIDPFWALAPSVSTLPFILSLPLDVGPPPFNTKHARIRYVLAATMLIRDQGKQYLVRSSQEVSVISVYDPEKALMSLPSPLTASDEFVKHTANGSQTIKVTAGLHRQVWVSGTSIFADVHIANSSKKSIKRLELQLEQDILFYKHSAAATLEKSASQARIFDSNERVVLAKASLKHGHSGWNGVPAYSSDLRTCDMELPRGHATVKCGKFFEVRYFLNVIVSSSHTKLVTVQLPIVLIHMNSLDVVPNSVAQVAAAIEEKRAHAYGPHHSHRISHENIPRPLGTGPPGSPRVSRRPSSRTSVQGRAFAAPRKQSLDRMRAEAEDLYAIRQLLDSSPRKYLYSPQRRNIRPASPQKSQPPARPLHPLSRGQSPADLHGYHTPPSNRKETLLGEDAEGEVADIRARLRRMRSNETNRSYGSVAPRPPAPPAFSIDPGSASVLRRQNSNRRPGSGFSELPEPPSDVRPESAASASGQRQFSLRMMRSGERWRGPSWFAERSRERDKEREEKQKMLANWI